MKEDYVSYELALKLRDLGFNEPIRTWYDTSFCTDGTPTLVYKTPKEGPIGWNNSELKDLDCVSAPTLALAAKWLREQHRVNVRVNHCYDDKGWFYDCLNLADGSYFDSDTYDTYEEAYAAGIEEVVDKLKGGEE